MKISDCRFAIGFAIAVTVGGCAAPEQSLLEQFFGASRLRDTTALQGVSTVTFEPLQQGIVRTFEITGVTPERVDGQTAAKDITVVAPVILPDGQTVRISEDLAESAEALRHWFGLTATTSHPLHRTPPARQSSIRPQPPQQAHARGVHRSRFYTRSEGR